MSNLITVRWFDGYREEFEAVEWRFGSDLLWLRLSNGKNRHIPLRNVRWFGLSIEDHQGVSNTEVEDERKKWNPPAKKENPDLHINSVNEV